MFVVVVGVGALVPGGEILPGPVMVFVNCFTVGGAGFGLLVVAGAGAAAGLGATAGGGVGVFFL